MMLHGEEHAAVFSCSGAGQSEKRLVLKVEGRRQQLPANLADCLLLVLSSANVIHPMAELAVLYDCLTRHADALMDD